MIMILYRRKHDFLNGKIAALILAISLVLSGTMLGANSVERFSIEHPFRNPEKYTDHIRCDNCGMDRNKWARTRHEFKTTKRTFYTCAIFCVAVMSLKIKEEPRDVKVAEYLNPTKMLDADKAFYVMGSAAPGTMTRVSKIAFSNKKEAVAFAAKYGGQVVRFQDALAVARKEALGER
jgi:nitrous oxide reductase accessory protein NosL